jgi:transposase
MGLGLSRPWIVMSSKIEAEELHIEIDFEKGAKFEGLSVHDTVDRTWRHMNFWQYPTYLHARVPRVVDGEGKVKQVEVPWARPGSGFTALFEALAITMCAHMPVSQVSDKLKVDDMALWRLLERAVEAARELADFSKVTKVGLDETASRRGHHYITKFVDLDASRVMFVCEGKAANVLKQFKADFVLHAGKPEKVRTFSSDMSPAFLSGIAEHFPEATVVLDKFHLIKMLSKAVDQTRRSEAKGLRGFRGIRFLFLKNQSRLKEGERQQLGALLMKPAFAQTAEAYRLRLAFQELFNQPKAIAADYLADWLDSALACGVKTIEDVAETFFKMRDKILSWFEFRISNGVLEGLNSVLQSAKNRARGYANPKHMIVMSYLLHGKLDLSPQALKTMPRTRRMSTVTTHSV